MLFINDPISHFYHYTSAHQTLLSSSHVVHKSRHHQERHDNGVGPRRLFIETCVTMPGVAPTSQTLRTQHRASASVCPAPVAWSASPELRPCDRDAVTYELSPRFPLPTLDLSVSMKSRFLPCRVTSVFNAFLRAPGLKLAGVVGMVCYVLMFVVPADVGRGCAIASALLYVPNVVAAFSLLRFDVVWLLVQTFDFWFSLLLSLATFTTLGFVMGDVRGLAMVGAWFGTVNNILIDANIRIVKVWVVFNVIAATLHSVTWGFLSMDLVAGVEHHALLRYGARELSSKDAATSGLATVIALIVRNVYRKRHVFRKAADAGVVECVSYRTDLKYIQVQSASSPRAVDRREGLKWCTSADKDADEPQSARSVEREHVKSMQYVQQVGTVQTRETLVRWAWVKRSVLVSSTVYARTLFAWLGVFSALATLLSSTALAYVPDAYEHECGLVDALHWSEVVAFALTGVYCSTCALHYQRTVLAALCSSFDFVFLSVQITIVHVSLGTYLRGRRGGCWGAATSWIWIHWVLTLDTLTPVMRLKLGLRKCFALAVLLAYASASVVLIWELVPADNLSALYHPVLLSGKVLGHVWEVRLIPVFCNCLGTAVVLCLRLVWRLARNDFDVLLVLNGAVTYENYLVTQRMRAKRQQRDATSTKSANVATAATSDSKRGMSAHASAPQCVQVR